MDEAPDLDGDDLGIGAAIKSGAFRGVTLAERTLGAASANLALSEIKNFLLLQHATALGSVIHATPLIAALRSAVPGCRIAVAASGISVEIYRHHPDVEAVVQTPSPLTDLWGAASKLRRQNSFHGEPFATLTSVANERTRVALSAVLGGATNRVGFALAPELYRAPLDLNRGISLIANNLRIIQALGHKSLSERYEPQVFFGAEDLEFAQRTLADAGIGKEQPVAVFVTQTSLTQRKSWRAERFQATAEFLHGRYGARIVFVGTADEAAAIDAIRSKLSFSTTSVAGKTNLTQLAALLSLCDAGLTLDTGTMHLGRAVGLPMVIVAPAWSPAVEWLPVGDKRFRILKNLDMVEAPPDYVIDEVTVDQVTTALQNLLKQSPAGHRRRV